MARPLVKHKQDGSRYVRPPGIEKSINDVLGLPRDTLIRRAKVWDRDDPMYMPSECLVHLIREAMRAGDRNLPDQLLPPLLRRCEAILRAKLRDDSAPNAADLRDEVAAEFAELFAKDGTGTNPDELDFYEVHFNQAFATLRLDAIRREVNRTKHLAQPLGPDEDDAFPGGEEWLIGLPSLALQQNPSEEETVFRKQVYAAINRLPSQLREVLILRRFHGFKEESEDPAERTVASICGVTGRTVRNRLRRAAAKLQTFLEKTQ